MHRARFLGDTPAPKLAVAGGARGPVGPPALRPVLTELRAPVTNLLAPALHVRYSAWKAPESASRVLGGLTASPEALCVAALG